MSVDVHLFYGRISGGVWGHGAISGLARFIGIGKTFRLLKALSCSIIRLAYLGLFSEIHASMPEVSKGSIENFSISMRWRIGSTSSTRWWNKECKFAKKSCLKRVNLEAYGTLSKSQKFSNF